MRRREQGQWRDPGTCGIGWVTVVAAVLTVSGCSRLSFVKPDLERKGYEQVAHQVVVKDNQEAKGAAGARIQVRRAQELLSGGDLDGASKAARAAIKADPQSGSAHTLLGAVFERLGRADAAGAHYLRATELAPGSGGVLNNYGAWVCGAGRAEESLQWFDRALGDRQYRTPAIALANAGACAEQAGLDARAERYLGSALDIDPDNPVALATVAERAFEAGDAFKARAFSERRLAAAPPTVKVLTLASQIEEKLGDRVAAAKYVQQMRAEFPNTGSGTGENGKQ
ncbi:MAG: type IV pilus biogenesis/stability protein PilW [Pseudomonadota bacterium]|nr:type IV pilus biogenesis/stability protein PilW [Pseudomonadota bacterium]